MDDGRDHNRDSAPALCARIISCIDRGFILFGGENERIVLTSGQKFMDFCVCAITWQGFYEDD